MRARKTIVKRWTKQGLARLLLGNIAVFVSIIIVIEGLASIAMFVGNALKPLRIAERLHVTHDPDLGWVNRPSVYIPDMYGPGVYLRTNAQRMRNNHDFDRTVPSGKRRIICSGDSFTLGYGVDNDHTWCELLTSIDDRLETVNMGQGGYGVDQAYLWYRRDAEQLDHQLLLFAFITDDFHRMQSDTSGGYGKPLLEVEDGTLAVKNVPVPLPGVHSDVPRIKITVGTLKQLRSVQILADWRQKLRAALPEPDPPPMSDREAKTRNVVSTLLSNLKELNEQRSSTAVLVYLPTLVDYKSSPSKRWTTFLEQQSIALGMPLINVQEELRKLRYEEVVRLFIPEGQIDYLHAAGHYNELGNEFVARTIYRKLINYPEISILLFPERAGTRSRVGDVPEAAELRN